MSNPFTKEGRVTLPENDAEREQHAAVERYLARIAEQDAAAPQADIEHAADETGWPPFLIKLHARHAGTFGATVSLCQHTTCREIRAELRMAQRREAAERDQPPARRDVTRYGMNGRAPDAVNDAPRTSGKWQTENTAKGPGSRPRSCGKKHYFHDVGEGSTLQICLDCGAERERPQ